MYAQCAAMEWTHLPNEGGLYAQSPKLLDDFAVINNQRALKERADEAKRERERLAAQTKRK